MHDVVYDAGALIAAERNEHTFWRRHLAYLEGGVAPVVTAPVLAQVWHGGARQVRLRFALRGCDVEPFTRARAEATGELLRRSGTADVVDASVVESAARWEAGILTSDAIDIEHVLQAASLDLVIERI